MMRINLAALAVILLFSFNLSIGYAQGGMYGECDEGPPIPGCMGLDSDCEGNSRCNACSAGLVLVGDKSGNQQCKQCKTGVNKCTMCTEDTKRCLMCKEGYRLVTNKNGKQKCKKCKASSGDNCFMCTEDLKKCETCYAGYFKLGKDGTCDTSDTASPDPTDAVKFCVESTFNLCSRCKPGYTLVTQENGVKQQCKKCKTGVKNCSECTADGKTCTFCDDGYSLKNGSCKKS
jgi:hypothetical protein